MNEISTTSMTGILSVFAFAFSSLDGAWVRAHGSVKVAIHRPTGTRYALKSIPASDKGLPRPKENLRNRQAAVEPSPAAGPTEGSMKWKRGWGWDLGWVSGSLGDGHRPNGGYPHCWESEVNNRTSVLKHMVSRDPIFFSHTSGAHSGFISLISSTVGPYIPSHSLITVKPSPRRPRAGAEG